MARSVGTIRWAAWCWLLAMLTLSAGAFALAQGESASTAGDPPELVREVYRLNHGDRLSVQVYGESELSKEYQVGSNGRISFPFLGEVEVIGLTASEIGERLVGLLRGSYLIDPKVTVTVVRYRPVYINGQVRQPGAQDFEPGLTVRQAISLAGGLTERASTRKIFLIPAGPAKPDKPRRISLDEPLRPGDTITVEESFF